jgi:hypothetical protein
METWSGYEVAAFALVMGAAFMLALIGVGLAIYCRGGSDQGTQRGDAEVMTQDFWWLIALLVVVAALVLWRETRA